MHPQILVAYDFRSASRKALAWAADLQRTLDAGPLHVIHVLNPLPAVPPGEGCAMHVLSREDVVRVEQDLAAEVLAVSQTAHTEVVLCGAPGAAILDTARRMGASLIVSGSHSHGALTRFFVGSCAEYVLRHASIPVVTIREPPSVAVDAGPQPRTP